MRSLATSSLLAITAAVLGWSLVGIFTLVMSSWRRLDEPNERSMHSRPVPAGAGIGIVATALLLWPWWHTRTDAFQLALLAGCVALGLVSLADDHGRLSPALRFGAQAAVVAVCLLALPTEARLVPILPLALERGVVALAWLWFINLFNFMDGIDGLAGSETIAVAIGYLAVGAFAGLDDPYWGLALVIAASAGGYLFWNWHPAMVFMGDAGSIPLGFLLGWLMLDLARRGLARRPDLAALFPGRCDAYPAGAGAARRDALAGAPPALLSARGPGRHQASRRGVARWRRQRHAPRACPRLRAPPSTSPCGGRRARLGAALPSQRLGPALMRPGCRAASRRKLPAATA